MVQRGKKGETKIKDPVRQAERASHLLRDALARAKRGGGEGLTFGHAVAFPDTKNWEARFARTTRGRS